MTESILIRLKRKGIQACIRGTTLWVCCQFCTIRGTSIDTKFRLGIELKGKKVPKGTAHCFNCGYISAHGLNEILGEAVSIGIGIDDPVKDTSEPTLPADFELLRFKRDEWTVRAFKYLQYRGMSNEEIQSYRVGISLIGAARGRVVFPLYESEKLIGWTARSLFPDTEPKWLHSPNLRTPYWASKTGRKVVVINEGVFDAISTARVIKDQADVMAILGVALSEQKKATIKQYEQVVLFLDDDSAGVKATIQLAEELAENKKQVWVVSNATKGKKTDPAEMLQEEIAAAFRNRVRWSTGYGLKLLLTVQ